MLTNDDFSKLKKLIREEVEAEGKNTREELSHDIAIGRMELSRQLNALGSRTKDLEISNQKILKDTNKIKKDLSVSINLTDKLQVKLENRVKVIEKVLKIPSPDFI